jgi:pimeloyl-ACP methyl ester carboxylesterase
MLAWAAMTTTTTWASGDVQTNGIRMHYYRTGGDGSKPPLVLSHGATDDGLCWTRVARALESEYDVIMPDARGHGLSEAPASGYASSDHAADLAGLIAALGLSAPAVAGHSMGAGTTLRLVAEHPELVRCAILEDPGFRSATDAQLRGGDAIRQVVLDSRTASREAVMARGRKSNPAWDESEIGPWADAKARVRDQFLNSMGARPMLEWQELLPRVQRPMLLITSDPERGSIVTPETAREAQRLLPPLQVVRIQGAGHNIRREQFDAFIRTVREFLVRN